jgi:hypothetical protein
MFILLTQGQREALLNSNECVGGLERTIRELQGANPGALHTEATLAQRFFFDQALHGEPHHGFVRSMPQQKAA